jgi:hypothetical protein
MMRVYVTPMEEAILEDTLLVAAADVRLCGRRCSAAVGLCPFFGVLSGRRCCYYWMGSKMMALVSGSWPMTRPGA